MKKLHFAITLFALSCTTMRISAQDPNYTQFLNNPLYYNPAYTGLYTGLKAHFAFRDLWPALPYDFKSYHFDAELGDRNLPGSGGLGLFLNTDNEGIGFIRNFNLGISLSVRIPFNAVSVGQLGLKASWLQKSINWEDFAFSDNLSERYGNIYQSGFIVPDQNVKNMPDFGVGGIFQVGNEQGSMTTTIGFAVDHLFEPDQSFLQTAKAPLPRKYVAHADVIFAAGAGSGMGRISSGSFLLNPGILYQSQGGLNSVQAGLNISKFGMNLGLWYKGAFGNYGNSSLAFLVGYGMRMADNLDLKFAYSYDMQMSGALQGTGGAHEFTVFIDFNSEGIFGGGYSGPLGTGRGKFEGQNPWECIEF